MTKIKYLTLALSLSATSVLMASPASTQQSILNVEQESTLKALPSKMPPPRTSAERVALIKKLLANPIFRAAFEKRLRHPNLTFTAKSVFTPAAVPMSWGDSDKFIGGAVSVGTANLTNNTFKNADQTNNTGTVSLMFSRWLAANTIASVGVINLLPWGSMKNAPYSYNAVMTQMLGVDIAGSYHPISVSLGIGSGALGPIGQHGAMTDSIIYPFLNGSFNVTHNIAVAGDYYGNTFALGLSYNKIVKFPTPLPLSFMVFAGNLKHSDIAPSTVFGLRVSTGMALPSFKRATA